MFKEPARRADPVTVNDGWDNYFVRLHRPLAVDGQAGASAQRQAVIRRDGASWAKGALGEQIVGVALNRLSARGVIVLHDRAIPGSRANIDHVVIGPTGVHVIDAKRYVGRIEKRGTRLYVGGRHRGAKLLPSMEKQVWEVEAALARPDIPVHAVLCFVDGNWGVFRRPMQFGKVTVTWPGDLERLVWAPGPIGAGDVQRLGAVLKDALPPAR